MMTKIENKREDIFVVVHPELIDNSVEEIIEGVLSIINGFYLHEVQTKNGVVNLLKFLRKNNIKMIVATSSDYNQIDKAFKRLKIRNFFTDIFV